MHTQKLRNTKKKIQNPNCNVHKQLPKQRNISMGTIFSKAVTK